MENVVDMDLAISPLRLGSSYPREEKRKYREQYRPLYRAILKSDWKAAQKVIDDDPTVLTAYISEGMETALHIAALSRDVQFVKNLVAKMDAGQLEIQNGQGNTALCFAAADGNTKIAELMISKNDKLPNICGPEGVKPIDMAASLGHREMVHYLHPSSQIEKWTLVEQAMLLTTCIHSGLYDVAFKMVRNNQSLIAARDNNGETSLHVLARMTSAFANMDRKRSRRRILDYNPFSIAVEFVSQSLSLKKAKDESSQQSHAYKLLSFTLEHILWHDEDGDIADLVKEIPGLLFVAAKVGNTEFLIALVDYYPDLMWKVDDCNKSIFHVAVFHRHQGIFNLLHEIGSIGSLIATSKDIKDNNMLHLAAQLAPPDKRNKVSGAALQMQRDLLWYMEVEKIVQPSYRVMKNKDGQTPHDIFKKEHKDLMKEGEDWMKSTATSCLVVATLIATVVFTAAFTVPGGLDSKSGVPILLNQPIFKVFAISEGIGMFSSSTTIVMLLSILTSRYREEDFLHSLPFMLMVGITTLFVSIAAMVIAFCTTIFLSFEGGSTLLPILLGVFSCIPIMSFIIKFPLLVDIICSTYDSRFLFRSYNCLFQENSSFTRP